MIFSHISDTHLGLAQYGSEEREQDVYLAFNEAVDTSISDHVDFVIFAGDIFHVPSPDGTAVVQMANALKRLKQSNIDSFFILGEHDISRIRTTPIPYVYHNLGFSSYIGQGKPIEYRDVLLCGFDKMRKSEIPRFDEKFKEANAAAKSHAGHRILAMHQGVTEFDKFAGELLTTDLPPDFTYYAMGHLHDHDIRKFGHLNGPVAYPGSTEITTSEGVKEAAKGFIEVDVSSQEAKTNWVKLDTRQQHSYKVGYDELAPSIDEIVSKLGGHQRKPVVELRIRGDGIESELIQAQVSRLDELTLRCFWRIVSKDEPEASVLPERPSSIDDELLRLSTSATGSEKIANFAIRELLPLLSSDQIKEASQVIMENFEKFRKERQE